MSTKRTIQTNETLIGKVQDISPVTILVSLFYPNGQEILGHLPRKYFPNEDLKVGQVFQYSSQVRVSFVKEKELSQDKIKRLYSEMDARLPHE
jgi:hypothetical protein